MRIPVVSLLLLALSAPFAAQTASGVQVSNVIGGIVVSPEDQKHAQQLLERARTTAQGLSDTEKAIALSRTAAVAPRVAGKDFAKEVAEELFKAALELPGTDAQRDAGLMQAITSMSALDVDRALVLLRSFPPSDPSQITSFANNRLDAAATRVFQTMWQKQRMKAIPALREAALQLSATDHYPFAAMGPVLVGVAREEGRAADRTESPQNVSPTETTAEAIFRESLDAYRNGPRSLVWDVSFANFLRSAGRVLTQDLPRPLAQQAVEAVALNLLTNQPSPGLTFRGIMETRGGGNLQFETPADFYLYRLLNSVGNLADGVRQKVLEARPVVGKALDTTATLNQLSVNETDNRRRDSDANPPRPAAPPDSPTARAEVLAKIAQGTSAEDAGKSLDEAIKAASAVSDKREQLRLLATIAEAAERAKAFAVVPNAVTRAFAVGDESVRRDADEQPRDRTPASLEVLTRVARVGMKCDADLTIAAIDGLSSAFVKAMLLANAADASLPAGFNVSAGR